MQEDYFSRRDREYRDNPPKVTKVTRKPRKAKASPKASKKTEEGPSETSDGKFRIQSLAFLLTYNREDPPFTGTDDEVGRLKTLVHFQYAETVKVSIAQELNEKGNIHYHAYLEKKTGKFDLLLSGFSHKDFPNPNCQINRGREQTRVDGHYYCLAPKIGQLANWRNFTDDLYPSERVIMGLWQKKKMTHENYESELTKFRGWTEHKFRNMQRQIYKEEAEEDAALRKSNLEAISKLPMQPFIIPPEVEEWKNQYNEIKHRYTFLILVGPSRTGKSQMIKSLFPNHFKHEKCANWNGYRPTKCDAIFFEDFIHPFKYISENRELMQANIDDHTVNESTTNMFARNVNVYRKPIVFTMNYDTFDQQSLSEWIKDNSVVYYVESPLF